MKKTVLLSCLLRDGGGVPFTFGMAQGLKANGCEVYLILSEKVQDHAGWEAEFGRDRIVYVDTHTSIKNYIPYLFRFFRVYRGRIRRAFRDISFDCVIHTMHHSWNRLVDRALPKGIRRIGIDHDPIPHSSVPRFRRWRYTRYYRKMPEVIVLSRVFIPVMVERFGHARETVFYMPHGRMNKYSSQFAVVPRERAAGKTHFLFFGYIVGYKGLSVLRDAWKILRARRDDVTLTVAGNGDLSPYDFTGLADVTVENRYIEEEEIGGFFSGDGVVAVLPYLDATQSGVIPVAMEYDVPVVATETGGILEQLDGGRVGILCPPNDAESLARAMENIAADRQEYERQRDLMRGLRESYNWDNVTKGLLEQLFG